MITFDKFGRHGRLGNQLFQYAAMIGIAKRYGATLTLPAWCYSKYFVGFPMQPGGTFQTVQEPTYHFTEFCDGLDFSKNINFHGYFQSEKYWKDSLPEVKAALQFKTEYKNAVRNKYKDALSRPTIAISIRRGDFVGNKNYAQLSIDYYFSALMKFFPLWTQSHNVLIFSDDMDYCKIHFGGFHNVYFAQNNPKWLDKANYWLENPYAIEQLCLMSMCNNFILSNSTFSWWGAYMAQLNNPDCCVIRPLRNLEGNLKQHSIKDYYPERWMSHDDERIDLSDVTFTIPVSYDHKDREENLSLNVCMLQRSFKTNIIIGEQGTKQFEKFAAYTGFYIGFPYKEFHRTKMLNQMAHEARTPIVVNWDADVFISPLQVWKAVELIRHGKADFVYPYDGRFARVPRTNFKRLEKSLDVGILKEPYHGTRKADAKSVGGAVIAKKQSFIDAGGENENFVSYGPEDVERELRFTRLRYKVARVEGILYHLDHFRGNNSRCATNPYDKQNHDELAKVDSMTYDELRNYSITLSKKHFNAN